MDKKAVDLAVALHGHLAPGIALGLIGFALIKIAKE